MKKLTTEEKALAFDKIIYTFRQLQAESMTQLVFQKRLTRRQKKFREEIFKWEKELGVYSYICQLNDEKFEETKQRVAKENKLKEDSK